MKNSKFLKIPMEDVNKIMDSMVEIELPEDEKNEEDKYYRSRFTIVQEVLTRIGFLRNNKLFQTAHILKKRGKYYICHFKQLFQLDGLDSTFDENDRKRLKKIAYILESWGMIKVIDRNVIEDVQKEENSVFINIVPLEKIKSGEIIKVKKYNL